MKRQVNIHEAKTHFSKLVAEVEAGGEVVIARAGKPIMKLVAVEEPVKRTIGFGKGKGIFPDLTDEEWEELDKEFNALFVEKPWYKDFS